MSKNAIDAVSQLNQRRDSEQLARSYQVADPRTDGAIPTKTTTESRFQAAVRVTMTLEAEVAREDARLQRPQARNREDGLDAVQGVAAYRNTMSGLRADQRVTAMDPGTDTAGARQGRK